MYYRAELERLATLDAETIERLCADPSAATSLIASAIDEYLSLEDQADDAMDVDLEHSHYCSQEAAAWRATVTLLRRISAGELEGRIDGDVAIPAEGVA